MNKVIYDTMYITLIKFISLFECNINKIVFIHFFLFEEEGRTFSESIYDILMTNILTNAKSFVICFIIAFIS